MYALALTGFALAIALAIMLHEFGHMLTAKAFGMKVTEYFVGFGPKVFSFRRGETEYGLKAIPAGGYVKIVGMTHLEQLPEEDDRRAFWRFSGPKRVAVLAAGSLTHFVLAFLVLWGASFTVGLPFSSADQLERAQAVVGQVSPCIPLEPGRSECSPDDPASPAVAAGLEYGDRVLAVDGQPVTLFSELARTVREAGPGPATLLLERDGESREVRVDLVGAQRPSLDDPERVEEVGALGISPAYREQFGVVSGLGGAVAFTGDLFARTWEAILDLPSRVPAIFAAAAGAERDLAAGDPVSVVGATRLGGQAVAADLWAEAVALYAGLNVFIGLLNLAPLLPFDGGHIAVLAFERARAAVFRLLRRPDPGPVDVTRLVPLTLAVAVVVFGLSGLLVYADLVNPIANPFAG
ncbi:MAG: site-2 protease family protein [Actinomycetota bacterium]|nr:site-2 protease family protein [Actinomycetota bacterium]